MRSSFHMAVSVTKIVLLVFYDAFSLDDFNGSVLKKNYVRGESV